MLLHRVEDPVEGIQWNHLPLKVGCIQSCMVDDGSLLEEASALKEKIKCMKAHFNCATGHSFIGD